MAIVLARLQPRNAQKGWLLKDYTSTRGNSYRAGEGGVPSPLVTVDDERELAELREYSEQFEFVEVADEQELAELLQHEMEQRVRAGGSPIRAEVLGVEVPPPAEPPPRRRLEALVPAEVPAPSVAARTAPRAVVDEDGDERFIPPPAPSAPPPDEGAPVRSHAAPKKGGRRGRG